jgi:hypothetical protein
VHSLIVKWVFFCCIGSFGFLVGGWTSPTDISGSDNDSHVPQCGVDDNGNVTVVWSAITGELGYLTVQSSTKPYGGSWDSPVAVSFRNDSYPQIAVDGNGNATAVWLYNGGSTNTIQASTKPYGGSWQAIPDDLFTTDNSAYTPQIAVDSNGNATAIWSYENESHYTIQASTKPYGGSWQAVPDDLFTTDNSAYTPQIAVDSNGNLTAAWKIQGETNGYIQSSSKPFGGSWTVPQLLSLPGQDVWAPNITVDSSGNATAVWEVWDETNYAVQASTKLYGGSWQTTPDTLSVIQEADNPQIAVDDAGNVTAVWSGYDWTNYLIQSSTKPFGGTWQAMPDTLYTSANGKSAFDVKPQIAVNGRGNAVAVWNIFDGTSVVIQASARPYGCVWQTTPDTLSVITKDATVSPVIMAGSNPNAYNPQVAMDNNGNATVVWTQSNGSYEVVQSAVSFWDPTVTDISPNSGSAGGGTSVTITGTDFFDVTGVSFGAASASSFTVDSLTTITAIAPPGTGTVDVRVEASSKTSPITSADQYTYQGSPSPTPPSPAQFTGKAKYGKKLSIKSSWKKSIGPSSIVRYEIFARNKKIKTISSAKKNKTTLRLHPHHVPHRLSKKYRLYLHDKYKIRAVDSTGGKSEFMFLNVKKH